MSAPVLADGGVRGVTPLTRIPDPRERPWLTVKELAEITGEGEKAIRAAIKLGQLPSLDVGRYVRIPTAALLAKLGIALESTNGSDATSEPLAEIRSLAAKTNTGGVTQHGTPDSAA